MNQEIQVNVVNEFGRKRIKPVDHNAELFCKLLGSKTLTEDNIAVIKQLGFAVTVVPEEL
jgi:hypothetical protein